MIYVQFADSTEAVIVSVFSSPQSATAYPNQGTVTATDSRYTTYVAALEKAGMPAPDFGS
jgi:hypothetical protein